jgi:hypothetical protein
MKARGTDVVLSNMASSIIPKPFSASVRNRIAHLPRVAATCTILVDLMSVENAVLTVRGPRPDSVTDLDGSRIRHDVTFADREFTPEGLKEAFSEFRP